MAVFNASKNVNAGKKTVSYGLKTIRCLGSETVEANPRWMERI